MSSRDVISTSDSSQDQDPLDALASDVLAVADHVDHPRAEQKRGWQRLSSFWQNRLVEVGMILSLGCYYLVGNSNLGASRIFTLDPLLSLPVLMVFALLAWYRLPFAVALLPVSYTHLR